ncbi:uncharacterized protein [Drosophila bipectinata]|uniref:uncharacterized protein isoform X2 n=1 Tax=Drosophila bipectinata TaxID=42026 RepID=UPI0038B3C260
MDAKMPHSLTSVVRPCSRGRVEFTLRQLFAGVENCHQNRPFTWSAFQNTILRSRLRGRISGPLSHLTIDKLLHIFQVTSILQDITTQHLKVEEMIALQVVVCILYLLPSSHLYEGDHSKQKARELVRSSYRLIPTLDPMMVHHMTNRLVNHFAMRHRTPSLPCKQILIHLANMLWRQSGAGRAVSVCLLWCIIFAAAQVAPEIYQFHDLSELPHLLEMIDVDNLSLKRIEQVSVGVALLLYRQLCCPDLDEFLNSGYLPLYFRILPEDVLKISNWLERALQNHRRCGLAARRLKNSLEYLKENSAQWCLQCRNPQTRSDSGLGPEQWPKTCVLSLIRKK